MAGLTRSQAFDALGLHYDATEDQIKRRFKKLALRWHPDKNLHNQKEAHEKFQSISAAYSRLAASETEEAIEDISPATLSKLITEIWDDYKSKPTGFWSYEDLSDSDPEEPGYRPRVWSDRALADHFLREILYKDFDATVSRKRVRRRQPKKSQWNKSTTATVPSIKISPEEASRHADELLQAEEASKQQEEKRKLKNKKRKDAKKKRRAKQSCDSNQEGHPPTNAGGSSDGGEGCDGGGAEKYKSDDEGSDEQVYGASAFVARAKNKKKEQPSKKKTVLATERDDSSSENKENSEQQQQQQQEREPARPSEKTKAPPASHSSTKRSNPNTNNTATKEAVVSEEDIACSRQLAGQGNRAAKDGHFSEAVRRYSEAIELYPKDHRYYGNRSFCYDYLKDYTSALEDAETALQLDASWPKGHYRKGKALAGLKKPVDAERAYRKALELDPDYKDATDELMKLCLNRLVGMGFQSALAEAALKEYKTVEAAVSAIVSGEVQVLPSTDTQTAAESKQSKQSAPDKDSSQEYYGYNGFAIPPRLRQPSSQTTQQKPPPAAKQRPVETPLTPSQLLSRSLWVGNLTHNVSDAMLHNLFSKYGEITYIRRLPDRHCAFVNYNQDDCARNALTALQGHHIGGCYLLIRFPENPPKGGGPNRLKKQASPSVPAKGRGSGGGGGGLSSGKKESVRSGSGDRATAKKSSSSAGKRSGGESTNALIESRRGSNGTVADIGGSSVNERNLGQASFDGGAGRSTGGDFTVGVTTTATAITTERGGSHSNMNTFTDTAHSGPSTIATEPPLAMTVLADPTVGVGSVFTGPPIAPTPIATPPIMAVPIAMPPIAVAPIAVPPNIGGGTIFGGTINDFSTAAGSGTGATGTMYGSGPAILDGGGASSYSNGGRSSSTTRGGGSSMLGSVDECYFWRTSGCSYGEKCCYLHLPESKGIDLNKQSGGSTAPEN